MAFLRMLGKKHAVPGSCNVCQWVALCVISHKYRKAVIAVIDAALCKKCREVAAPTLYFLQGCKGA